MVVPDEDTAIAVANDTKYGLGGSVYTRDIERGRRVADQIEASMVFINHPAWTYEDMPFGGIKKSGYGRETGPLGIQEFVNKKLIRVLQWSTLSGCAECMMRSIRRYRMKFLTRKGRSAGASPSRQRPSSTSRSTIG